MDLTIDPDELTIADVADIEDAVGRPINELFTGDSSAPQGRALQALVWISMRRDNPSFTFEDAGKVKFTDIKQEASEDPTSGKSEKNG